MIVELHILWSDMVSSARIYSGLNVIIIVCGADTIMDCPPNNMSTDGLYPLLLTWFNFNPSMDK